MASVIAWCGFFGAWLLVAGPLYQAAIELREEDLERDALADLAQQVERPTPVSSWWWLVPPVHVWLKRRRGQAFRRAVFARLSAEQRAAFVTFVNKATGWMFVGLGGLLIAVKETWELRELEEWPAAVFWVLIVVMSVAAAANTAVRMNRERHLTTGASG